MSEPRHPFRLTAARRLADADTERHVADLVRLVLLTGQRERLHRPGFGAGLGASALFAPLDDALVAMVELRARGSLEEALGERIDVLSVSVARTGETTVEAAVEYRLRPAGDPAFVEVSLHA